MMNESEKIERKQLIKFDSLLEFSASLNETYDEDFILNSALLSLMGKLKIYRGCVLTPIGENSYRIAHIKGRLDTKASPNNPADPSTAGSSFAEVEKLLRGAGYEYFLSAMHRGNILAVLCLGKKARDERITKEEEQYSSLISVISANALQNARNHQSLILEKNKVEMRSQLLGTLFDMGRDFSALLNREQILKMTSYHLMGQLMVSRFLILLLDEAAGFEIIINRFSEAPDADIVKEMTGLQNALHIDDAKFGPGVESFLERIEAKILSPMKVQGVAKGLLIAGKKMTGGPYDAQDLKFVEALSSTSILAIENERLFNEEVEKKKLERELDLALDIQNGLLPKSVPEIPSFKIAGATRPSKHVGGDYYDYIRISESETIIAIADVSGKGMPAALLMANVQASLRLLAPLSLPLVDMTLRINELLYQNTASDKFVTFFCGVLNSETRVFSYVNAGHNPPLWSAADGEISTLTEGGLILGITDEPFEYLQGEIALGPGDAILFYTDGITEALNKENKEFGEQRLEKLFENNAANDPRDILNTILNELRLFSDGAPQSDDITCIVLKAY